jgi:hypothetical protein
MSCNKKAKYQNILNNTIQCTQHAKQYYKNYVKNSLLKGFKVKDSRTLNFDSVKIKLIQELESKPQLLKAHGVVIENQPSFKNPRMKSIASTLYDYYLIRGVFDKMITSSNIMQVKFMSPSNKLKLASDGDTKELVKVKQTSETKSYKMTKSLGIKYCAEMIQHLPEWLVHFNSHKKKDDLADAFLQGVYFITTNDIPLNTPILSFDVGVVHLAYCLVEKTSVGYKIIEWNNIDLTDRMQTNCHCGKKASLTHTLENETKYYCKVHAKKVVVEKKLFEDLFSINNNSVVCQH